MRVLLQFIFIKILMLSNTMICSPVLIGSARGKSSPDLSCFPDWLHLLLIDTINPIQGALFEPPF